MALFNALLGRGPQYANLLRRLMGLHEGIASVSPELQPTLPLDMNSPEWHYLQDEKLVWGGLNAPAGGAGVFSYVQLQNRSVITANPIILIVDRIVIMENAGVDTTYQVGIATNGPAGLPGQCRDTRLNPGLGFGTGATGQGLIRVGGDRTGDGVAMAIRPLLFRIPANTSQVLDGPWVIGPGLSLTLTLFAANQTCGGSFIWMERPLFEMER